MHRPADAFGQAEQVGDDAQAIGVGGLQAEIDPARGLVVQTLDAALAVQRQRARCGEVELLHVEHAALQREARIELARGNVGKQKLADAQRHAQVVVGKLGEHALVGGARFAGGCGRRPELPERSFAHHLAQIETVAVEIELDQRTLAAVDPQVAIELGAAQLAGGVGEIELAVADAGIGHEAEIAD